MYIRLHSTAEYFQRVCKVSQGASTLFKVRQVMQEPFEASLSTLVFIAMSDNETASVPHASYETSNVGDSAQLSAPSSDTSLSNAETLRLFSQLLDAKFDQKFATFKRDLEDKEATTQSELKMLKIESKAANSFTFKGNKVQCELNVSLHDLMDGAIKNISKGNLSAAISELESVKTLLTKRNKLIRFADKSRAGWTAVEEYESDELAGDSEDERKLRSAERRALAKIREKDRHRLPELAIQVPVSHRVKFLLLGLPILSLLIRNFFVGSPFASVDLNLQTSASVAGREATGQIQLPAQAALEEPLQFLQATRPQTDDKLKVALQRLGKDEYNLLNLVTCLRWLNTVSARSAVLCKSQRGFSKANQTVKYV